MGKHRKPSKLQRSVYTAVPIFAICAVCVLAGSSHTKVNVAADVLQRPVSPAHSLTVEHPESWAITQFKAVERQPPHIVRHHKKPHVAFNTKVIRAAESQIGVPYVWGGETPGVGFDCSGLTEYAYGQAGRWIPRVADDQFHFFRMIPKSEARPGDLVFFHDSSYSESYVYHTGIYLGGNDMMVAAGDPVQIQNFDWGGDTVTFGTLDIH